MFSTGCEPRRFYLIELALKTRVHGVVYGWFLLPVSAMCARYDRVKALYWDGVMAATEIENKQDNIVHYLIMIFFCFGHGSGRPGFMGDSSTTGVMGNGRIAKLVNHGLSDMHSRRPWSEPKRT